MTLVSRTDFGQILPTPWKAHSLNQGNCLFKSWLQKVAGLGQMLVLQFQNGGS